MSTRKSKTVQTEKPTSPLVMGFDSGYGEVKAVSGEHRVKFPSVSASTHEIAFSADAISAKYPGEQLTDDEGDWWVGNFAIQQAPINEQFKLQGRTNNSDEIGMAFRKRMLYAALAKQFPIMDGNVYHIFLVTGLPVSHMKDSGVMKKTFIGQHPIRTNNANFIANIIDCRVMPQPYGVIYSQTILPDGQQNEYHLYNKTAVVDVGNHTVDCAVDDEGEFIDPESDSAQVGVYTAHERLTKILVAKWGDGITREMVDQVLRTGVLRAFNELHEYHDEVQEVLKPLRDGTLSLTNRLWKTGLGHDVVLIAGGGANYTEGVLKKAYSHAVVVKDPQMAIAQGYYNYGMSVINEA